MKTKNQRSHESTFAGTRVGAQVLVYLVLVILFCFAASLGCGGNSMNDHQAVQVSGAKDGSAADQPTSSSPKVGARMVQPQIAGTSIDDTSAPHFGPSQYWHVVTGYGVDNDITWTYVNGSAVSNAMEWRSGLPSGTYEVRVFVPRNYASTQSAHYRVKSGDTTLQIVTVNQNNVYDSYVSLGSFSFAGEPRVYLGDDTGESYSGTHRMIAFDQVMFVPVVTSDAFAQFRSKYSGVFLDYDHAYGAQCVDLTKAYCAETLHITPISGNGKDYQYNYPRNHFVWIPNTPTGVPGYGDIVVWGSQVGGGFGHVSVFISGNTSTFQSFDQNWPLNSSCHVQTHNYTYVKGWLHFTG